MLLLLLTSATRTVMDPLPDLPAVNIGDRVTVGEERGIVREISRNIGFETYEVEFCNGKIRTEPRYRIDHDLDVVTADREQLSLKGPAPLVLINHR